jgi:serine/threonine protein kinase/tetratricopeptide (TPR) repeat protein
VSERTRLDLRDQLQATLGAHYTLEHELTGGAMSRVFAAQDAVLSRRIVVKVLSPELAEGVSAERFAREIRIAASLNQANIVPLLATGETNGLPYYTMPFVDGLSLRDRLKKDGALPVNEAFSVMRDVARALAFAHQHGVVHRDIKPENVLLSGDAAVVTDFGIAKAISVAKTTSAGAASHTLTAAGIAIGTPAYMAPEQISGEDQDHRTDIYAFGCLAYELIAGRPPFTETSARELFAAHITRDPTPLSTLRRDCPSAISDIVMHCLQKDPGRRPQSARELLSAMDAAHIARPSNALRGALRSPAMWPVVGAIVLALVIFLALANQTSSDIDRSVAVLPLTNIGGDSAQEYLADGMTDELATALGKMRVRVASRSLAGRYRGQRDLDVREVGRSLAVSHVLQGSVRRVGDKLRVNAVLTNATDGIEVWSDSYDRNAEDVFAVQDEITRGVAGALGAAGRGDTEVRGTRDVEAYDKYLRGQFLLRRRGPGVRQAARLFEEAIARDGNFARAHAALAAALQLFPYFAATSAADVHAKATAAARRALELDSTLAEAHTALGLAYMHALDWTRALESMKRAVELDPTDASAHHQYGRVLLYTGQADTADAEFRRAKSIDPFSALYSSWVALTMSLRGDQAGAEEEIRRAIEIDSLNPVGLQVASRVYMYTNRQNDARRAAMRLPELMPWNAVAAYVYARIGDRERALRVRRSIEQTSPPPWFAQTASAYVSLGLGDTARALTALEKATELGEIWPSFWPLSDPMFDEVRNSPRFAELERRVGLSDRFPR